MAMWSPDGRRRVPCSALGELVEPTVVGRTVWPPPNEAGRGSEPTLAVKKGVRHLTDGRRCHGEPCRHRRMLPARVNRVLFWSSPGKHLVQLRREHVFGVARKTEMVQST